MCMHLFVFSATIVCNLVWSCTKWSLDNSDSSIKDKDLTRQEIRVHRCKLFLVQNIFIEILYALNIVMLCLLIYITEKATATPLQEFW